MFVFSVNGLNFMLHVMSTGIAMTADENAINVSQRANNETPSHEYTIIIRNKEPKKPSKKV